MLAVYVCNVNYSPQWRTKADSWLIFTPSSKSNSATLLPCTGLSMLIFDWRKENAIAVLASLESEWNIPLIRCKIKDWIGAYVLVTPKWCRRHRSGRSVVVTTLLAEQAARKRLLHSVETQSRKQTEHLRLYYHWLGSLGICKVRRRGRALRWTAERNFRIPRWLWHFDRIVLKFQQHHIFSTSMKGFPLCSSLWWYGKKITGNDSSCQGYRQCFVCRALKVTCTLSSASYWRCKLVLLRNKKKT